MIRIIRQENYYNLHLGQDGYDLDSSTYQPLVRQEVQVSHRQIQKNHYSEKQNRSMKNHNQNIDQRQIQINSIKKP